MQSDVSCSSFSERNSGLRGSACEEAPVPGRCSNLYCYLCINYLTMVWLKCCHSCIIFYHDLCLPMCFYGRCWGICLAYNYEPKIATFGDWSMSCQSWPISAHSHHYDPKITMCGVWSMSYQSWHISAFELIIITLITIIMFGSTIGWRPMGNHMWWFTWAWKGMFLHITTVLSSFKWGFATFFLSFSSSCCVPNQWPPGVIIFMLSSFIYWWPSPNIHVFFCMHSFTICRQRAYSCSKTISWVLETKLAIFKSILRSSATRGYALSC